MGRLKEWRSLLIATRLTSGSAGATEAVGEGAVVLEETEMQAEIVAAIAIASAIAMASATKRTCSQL